jgi:hypothetical protein
MRNGRLVSLRGIEVESIEPSAVISRVPGSPFGMALVRGQIVPVARAGEVNGCLVVGHVGDELMGIAGLDVVDFTWDDGDIDAAMPQTPRVWEAVTSESDHRLEDYLDVAAFVDAAAPVVKDLP